MSGRKFGILCTIPGLVVVVALIFYPVLYNTYVSFLRYDNISPTGFTGLRNYGRIFLSPEFYSSWRVSSIYGLATTGLTLFLGLILAHSLHRIVKGRVVFRTLVILPWAAPLVVSGFMWKWMLDKEIGVINYWLSFLGLIDRNIGFLVSPSFAMMSGILASSWSYTPFVTILLLAGLESIPRSHYEAAQIDGANQLQMFWHISLPQNRYQMLIASLIILMFSFRTPDIFFALTGGGPGKSTYPAGMFLLDTIYKYLDFGQAGAISVILFLSVVGFTFPILYYGIIKRSG